MIIHILLFSLLTAVTHAAKYKIIVGHGAFNPANITAMRGDTITFEFREGNHSATQTTFDSPCGRGGVGFNSGFMPVGPDPGSAFPNYTVEVNGTAPIWVYSAQTVPVTHCAFGMVFSVNALELNDIYIFRAAAVSTNTWQSLGSRSSGPRGGTVFSSIKRQLFKRQANNVVIVVVIVLAGVVTLVVIAAILWVRSRCVTSHKLRHYKHNMSLNGPRSQTTNPKTNPNPIPHPLQPPSGYTVETWQG